MTFWRDQSPFKMSGTIQCHISDSLNPHNTPIPGWTDSEGTMMFFWQGDSCRGSPQCGPSTSRTSVQVRRPNTQDTQHGCPHNSQYGWLSGSQVQIIYILYKNVRENIKNTPTSVIVMKQVHYSMCGNTTTMWQQSFWLNYSSSWWLTIL